MERRLRFNLAAFGLAVFLFSLTVAVKSTGAQEDVSAEAVTATEVVVVPPAPPPPPTEPPPTSTAPPTATTTPTATAASTEVPTLAATDTPMSTPEVSPTELGSETATIDPTATSTPTSTPSPTTTAAVAPQVTIRIESADVNFGEVNARGDVDPNVQEVTSSLGEGSAWYVKERAIRVTVESNGPWAGKCWAVGVNGSDSRLFWRPTGTKEWTAFETSVSDARSCFPRQDPGSVMFEYDLELWVSSEATPGQFIAEVGFKVTPEDGA